MSLDIREFGPEDAPAVAAFAELVNVCNAVDAPWQPPECAHRQELMMRHGWDGEVGRYFLGYDAGLPVAALSLHTSDYDNLELMWHGVAVHPERRRRGHGSALIAFADSEGLRTGRTLLGYDGWDTSPAESFAVHIGASRKSQAINRRMPVREVPAETVDALHAEAAERAGDYELLRISGHTPAELLEPLAVATAAINDAPLDDLEIEDETFTVERVLAYENAQLASEHRLYRVIARRRGTGQLGGHTVVSIPMENPGIAHQHDTSVVAAHRGHRLGLLLKTEMVRWIRDVEPQVEHIGTWNAESNAHMISVNERLGYQVMGRGLQFQRRLRAS